MYIAPLQGNLLRGALCAGLYDVKCRYERIFSVSAKIRQSKLKESLKTDPRIHTWNPPTDSQLTDGMDINVMLVGSNDRLTMHTRSFSLVGPTTWNGFPLGLRHLPNGACSQFHHLLNVVHFHLAWVGSA